MEDELSDAGERLIETIRRSITVSGRSLPFTENYIRDVGLAGERRDQKRPNVACAGDEARPRLPSSTG